MGWGGEGNVRSVKGLCTPAVVKLFADAEFCFLTKLISRAGYLKRFETGGEKGGFFLLIFRYRLLLLYLCRRNRRLEYSFESVGGKKKLNEVDHRALRTFDCIYHSISRLK